MTIVKICNDVQMGTNVHQFSLQLHCTMLSTLMALGRMYLADISFMLLLITYSYAKHHRSVRKHLEDGKTSVLYRVKYYLVYYC